MVGRRRSDRVLWAKLRSPGRPGVARREDRRRFWALIADDLSSEDAAMVVGMSQPVGSRWFWMAGGLAPSHLSRSSKPLSGRRLLFTEREEIALSRAQGLGVPEAARCLGRSASTVSRALRRNAVTRSGDLDDRAATGQRHAERTGRRPKPTKLERHQPSSLSGRRARAHRRPSHPVNRRPAALALDTVTAGRLMAPSPRARSCTDAYDGSSRRAAAAAHDQAY